MKLQLIAAALASTALSFGAFGQSATDSGASSAPPSSCDSLSGEEKTKCLEDESSSQSPADSASGATSESSSESSSSEPGSGDSSTGKPE